MEQKKIKKDSRDRFPKLYVTYRTLFSEKLNKFTFTIQISSFEQFYDSNTDAVNAAECVRRELKKRFYFQL